VSKEDNRPFALSEGIKVGDVPYFQDGAILIVTSRAPKKEVMHSGIKAADIESNTISAKCNHPPGGKCLNCISVGAEKTEEKKEKTEGGRCNHGPGGKCLNCSPVDLKDK
jgi:hypothetical protein